MRIFPATSIASQVFNEELFKNCAMKSADFIINNMLKEDGRLYHRFKDCEAAIDGMLDDYAFLAFGLIELYEAGFEEIYLQHAIKIIDIINEDFLDDEIGGYYFSSKNAESLPIKNKNIYDGAIPSGNSVMHYILVKLSMLTGNIFYDNCIDKIEKAFSHSLEESPMASSFLLNSMIIQRGKSQQIVFVESLSKEENNIFLNEIRKYYSPLRTVIKKSNVYEQGFDIFPNSTDYVSINNKATVYICNNFSCSEPINELHELRQKLKEISAVL